MYSITELQKKEFASAYVLNKIIKQEQVIPLLLEGNDQDVEPVLEYMMMKDYVTTSNKESYTATQKGEQVLSQFSLRYSEFLKVFDIYCAVDLESGSFAFEEIINYDSDKLWDAYLEQDRWEDLRVAVAVFKKINPIEIVFMSFLEEGRYGKNDEGWQFDLLLGTVWNEILNICNTALTQEQLAYKDADGQDISGESVMKDILVQGAELLVELRKEERSREALDEFADDDFTTNEIEPVVYESYYDPYYISPIWLLVVFI